MDLTRTREPWTRQNHRLFRASPTARGGGPATRNRSVARPAPSGTRSWPGMTARHRAAMRWPMPPGTVHVLSARYGPLTVRTGAGNTHGLGLAEVIELGRALRRLPPELVIVGVEGQRFGLGDPMSPQVRACVERAATAVAEVIRT